MTSFLLPLFLMLLVAALFVLIPVFRFRNPDKNVDQEIRNQKNVEVFKQRINELEEDLAEELIVASEFEKLKAELQRGFMHDMDEAATQKARTSSTLTKVLPLALLAVLFVSSFFFYRDIGSAQDLVIPELMTQIQEATSEDGQRQAISDLSIALNDRYQRHTDNIQAGYTLGGIYLSLEEYPDAIRIFSQLADLMEDSPDKGTVLGQLAQSQYLRADSEITAVVRSTIDLAMTMNPNEQAIMSLLAVDALVNQNYAEAISYWRKQLLQLSPSSGEAAQVRQRIALVEELVPAEELAGGAAVASGVSVTVRVEIDDSIRGQIADDMRLFIFARGEAVPLPLAAQTFSPNDLPLTITLDDSMAMTPQFTLSSAERVYVGARISRVATAQSGDFQAISETFTVADQEEVITLTIKDMVP